MHFIRLSGRTRPGSTKSGRDSYLSAAEEEKLCNHIEACSIIGYPLDRRDIKLLVMEILEKDGRPTPFKDNIPGINWTLHTYTSILKIAKMHLLFLKTNCQN